MLFRKLLLLIYIYIWIPSTLRVTIEVLPAGIPVSLKKDNTMGDQTSATREEVIAIDPDYMSQISKDDEEKPVGSSVKQEGKTDADAADTKDAAAEKEKEGAGMGNYNVNIPSQQAIVIMQRLNLRSTAHLGVRNYAGLVVAVSRRSFCGRGWRDIVRFVLVSSGCGCGSDFVFSLLVP